MRMTSLTNKILLPHWMMSREARIPNRYVMSNTNQYGMRWLSEDQISCYMLLFSGSHPNFFGTCKNRLWTWRKMMNRRGQLIIRHDA
jgi:hypothetical protein